MTQGRRSDEAVRRAIENAPFDERPMTAEERRAIARARKKGRYVTTEALRARLARRRAKKH